MDNKPRYLDATDVSRLVTLAVLRRSEAILPGKKARAKPRRKGKAGKRPRKTRSKVEDLRGLMPQGDFAREIARVLFNRSADAEATANVEARGIATTLLGG